MLEVTRGLDARTKPGTPTCHRKGRENRNGPVKDENSNNSTILLLESETGAIFSFIALSNSNRGDLGEV